MNIQPIETFYKGYKFRSRLEARWAVFFTELGIKWQYEVEGFELSSGRYLPDFYLPDFKCYFEVKPPPVGDSRSYWPKVYMAGRMAEPCWRPIDAYNHQSSYCDVPAPCPKMIGGRQITYTGPFRTDLSNHSFLHGLDGAAYCGEPKVFRRSVAGIKSCDVFFAYFEDLEAYGTLVELGMAHALGKRIVVGFTDNAQPERWNDWQHGDPTSSENDLWFAANCTETVLTGERDYVLKEFSDWLAVQYPVPKEISLATELCRMTRASVYVVYGDPVDAYSDDGDGGVLHWGDDIFFRHPEDMDAAALKARQARFEFGQSGASKN